MLLVRVAGALIVVVLVLAYVWRGRMGARRASPKVDTRPTLPPSPYQPSRGFKILDGNEPEEPHEIQLPRLDPHKEFVFGDHIAPVSESISVPHLRHDEQWALDRSMRHAPHPRVRRRRRLAWTLVVIVLAVAVITILWLRVPPHVHHPAQGLAYSLAPNSWMT